MPSFRLFAAITILVLGMFSGIRAAEEIGANLRYLEELRRQGEIERMEAVCRRELGRDDLNDEARAAYTVALMQSLADRALAAPPDVRDTLFAEAEKAADAFLQTHPDASHGVLVRLQSAINRHLRGEIARLESEAAGEPRRSFDGAIRSLREAAKGFETVHAEAETLSRDLRIGADFSRDELINLEKSARHHWAESLTDLARCYPAESPDRVDLLGRASKLLAPLAGGDPRHPLTWQARVDRVRCERLLGHFDTAVEQLRALAAAGPPDETRLAALAESIRLALDAGRLDEAVAGIKDLPPFTSKQPKTLALVVLDTALAARRESQAAGDVAAAEAWAAKVEQVLRDIDRLYGPYWSRRAQMRAAKFTGRVESEDLAMLTRAAELAVQEDRLDDAVAFYDRARAAAVKQGDTNRAFENGYAAAAIEHRRNRSAEALRRFREVAAAASENPLAPEAHLLAAWHAGRLVEQNPKDAQSEATFLDVLREHLRLWPGASTANRARYQLGLLLERADRPAEAVEVLHKISTDFSSYPDVLESIGRCIRLLAKRTPSDAARLTEDAASWFENLIYGPGGTLPQRWSPAARAAAVEAARFLLETPQGPPRAEKLLRGALADSAGADAAWRSQAETLLIAALAAEGKQEEALALADARLEKAAAKDRAALERTQAELLAKTGNREAAVDAFKKLVEKYPKNAGIRRRLAELLSEGSNRTDWEHALEQWRTLAEGLPPGTPEWFEAKYHTAETQLSLGNPETAARIITVLQITRPELGGPEMKERFLRLLESSR